MVGWGLQVASGSNVPCWALVHMGRAGWDAFLLGHGGKLVSAVVIGRCWVGR